VPFFFFDGSFSLRWSLPFFSHRSPPTPSPSLVEYRMELKNSDSPSSFPYVRDSRVACQPPETSARLQSLSFFLFVLFPHDPRFFFCALFFRLSSGFSTATQYVFFSPFFFICCNTLLIMNPPRILPPLIFRSVLFFVLSP